MVIGIKLLIKAHKLVVALVVCLLQVALVEVVAKLTTSTKSKSQMVRPVSPYIDSKVIMSQHSLQNHITLRVMLKHLTMLMIWFKSPSAVVKSASLVGLTMEMVMKFPLKALRPKMKFISNQAQ